MYRLAFFLKDGTVIATRYVYRLRIQKKEDRSRRLGYFHALSMPPSKHTRQPSDSIELLHPRGSIDTSYSTVPYIDPYDLEDPTAMDDSPLTIDIRNPRGHGARPSQLTASSDGSSQQIRALPPRPNTNSTDVVAETQPQRAHSNRSLDQEMVSPREDGPESLYTAELSTTAHSALMDHAAYMRPVFSSSAGDRPAPGAPPPYSGPLQRLRLGKRP